MKNLAGTEEVRRLVAVVLIVAGLLLGVACGGEAAVLERETTTEVDDPVVEPSDDFAQEDELPAAVDVSEDESFEEEPDLALAADPVIDYSQYAARDPEEPAAFYIEGTEAIMVGVIGSATPDRVEDLLNDNPDVNRIILYNVPGSEDDEANLEAAFMVFDAQLATHVPASGEIASGGVDFFLAGWTRTYEPGAKFGVHSWSTGEEGFNATSLGRDDPEHERYLEYYDEIGVEADFYWFTLEAAPPESIHFMTEEELARFGFTI